MRIEKIEWNKKAATISCLRQLCFSEEKERQKVRAKTADVAEIHKERLKEDVKIFRVNTRRAVQPGNICGPLPRNKLRY